MTDPTPPSELDEVVVTGQRRKTPASPFPGGVGGGGGLSGGANQQELEEEDGLPPDGAGSHPCDDPVQRKIWNADAAAAAAAAALIANAASMNDGSSLSNREFGVNLILGAGGQVQPQPNISVGDPAVPGQITNVDIDMTGVNAGNWMGDVHNHPSGDGRLSNGEWVNFINFVSSISATNPDRLPELAHVSVYVVVLDPTSPHGYRVYAYDRDSPPDTLGQEVNPDAQPCPIT
jgi:hypothetical protein